MKKNYTKYFFLGVCCSLLSGCGRIIDWAKDSFYQGEEVEAPIKTVNRHMRSVTIYDQLDTAGMFDVLWLSDEVRHAYASVHAAKYVLSEADYKHLLDQQLAENKHYITLYVLSLDTLTQKRGTVLNLALRVGESSAVPVECKPINTQKGSVWSLLLRIGDDLYAPVEIKQIDFNPEYELFFGERLTKFKESYVVRFAAQNDIGEPLLHAGVSNIGLQLRSTTKETELIWQLDSHLRVKEEHRIYTSCSKAVSRYSAPHKVKKVSQKDKA